MENVEVNYREGKVNVTVTVSKDIANFLEMDRKRRANEARRDRRHVAPHAFDERFHYDESLLVENIILKNEKCKSLKSDINLLTEKQRRRLQLYFFHNLTYAEIATIEEVTTKSIQQSVNSALDFLAKQRK